MIENLILDTDFPEVFPDFPKLFFFAHGDSLLRPASSREFPSAFQ
jgi:hypothetical protein